MLCLALMTSVALAAAPESFDTYLSSAAVLHEALEFEQALAALAKAKAAARNVDDEVVVALWRGVVLADSKQTSKAEAAFREGLSLDIEAKLPTATSPTIRREFEAIRSNLRPFVKPRPAAVVPAPVVAVVAPVVEKPWRPGSRPLAGGLAFGGLLSGAASVTLGLLVPAQVSRAQAAYFQSDATAPVRNASTFATASLATGILAGSLLVGALISWILAP